MPTVEFDVQNIPDIIEAQLTLSYSRLTDLIRVIIDQGNGHENDIDEMRERLDQLERENSELKDTIEELRNGKDSDSALESLVEELKKELERLAQKSEEADAQREEENASSQAATDALKEGAAAMAESLQALEDKHAAVSNAVEEIRKDTQLAKAFTELWAGRPEQIIAMAARDEENPEEFEHSVDERTEYLHKLPAFARLMEELEVTKELVNRQAAESLKAKMRGANNNNNNARNNSDSVVKPQQNTSSSNVNAAGEGMNHTSLEEVLASAPIVELQQRVEALETVVDGMPRSAVRAASVSPQQSHLGSTNNITQNFYSNHSNNAGSNQASHNQIHNNNNNNSNSGSHHPSGEVASSPVGRDMANPRASPFNAVEAFDDTHSSPTGAAADNSVSRGSERRSPVLLQPAGASNQQQQSPRRSASAPKLPPLHHATSPSAHSHSNSNSARATPPSTAAVQRGNNFSSANLEENRTTYGSQYNLGRFSNNGSSVGTPQSRPNISQPMVEELRRRDSVSRAPPDARRISVAVEQEDGLRLRVTQLEENAAILEINKADRRELQRLEQALQNMMNNNNNMQKSNNSNNNSNMNGNNNGYNGQGSPYENGLGAAMTPHRPTDGGFYEDRLMRGGNVGRPMFLGSAGVYLRDGARATSATISPTRPTNVSPTRSNISPSRNISPTRSTK